MATLPGFVIWLTGLPAAGKSTLARILQQTLAERGVRVTLLDSDTLRTLLTPKPDYSEQERAWFYGVIAWLAAELAANGVNVVIAATGHRRAYRDQARACIARFDEVYVRCSLTTCQQRDPKGIYARATAGQASGVPGVGVVYEPPLRPEVIIDTEQLPPPVAAQLLVEQLHLLPVPASDLAAELARWIDAWPELRARFEALIVAQAQADICFDAYRAERTLEEFQQALHRLAARLPKADTKPRSAV